MGGRRAARCACGAAAASDGGRRSGVAVAGLSASVWGGRYVRHLEADCGGWQADAHKKQRRHGTANVRGGGRHGWEDEW
eukprot:361458-Chlamydomonas_euryale.AAC.5